MQYVFYLHTNGEDKLDETDADYGLVPDDDEIPEKFII